MQNRNKERMAHPGTASNSQGSSQGFWEVTEVRLERFMKDFKGSLKGLGLVTRLVPGWGGMVSKKAGWHP